MELDDQRVYKIPILLYMGMYHLPSHQQYMRDPFGRWLGKVSLKKYHLKILKAGNYLAVQWLGLGASSAGGPSPIPGQGARIP